MSSLREPRLETRRSSDLSAELFARARAWLPTWQPPDPASDFAGALFAIAARFESEVAQRLDKVPEKMYRGFLQWLGVRGLAAQAAQIPLVFGLAPGTNAEPVLAQAPIQAQATPPQAPAGSSPEPITFETEHDLMIVPGSLAALIGADPANDAFYQAPAGFSALQPPAPGPDSWNVVTIAPAGSAQIQLSPPLGLDSLPTLLDPATNTLYIVSAAQGGLVTVDPPVVQTLQQGAPLSLQNSFTPFSSPRRNLQEHAVYIGSDSLLNLPTNATIGINGISDSGISWFYWGKKGSGTTIGWQTLTPVSGASILTLSKTAGSVEESNIGGNSSRWLKGTVPAGSASPLSAPRISLIINPAGCGQTPACPSFSPPTTPVAIEAMANTTPLVLNVPFYPLGREPRLFDAFYIGCPEAFSKSNASVSICFQALDGTAGSFSAAQATSGAVKTPVLFGIGSDGFLHRMRPGTDPVTPVVAKTAVRPPFDQSGRSSMNSAPASLSSPQLRLSICPRKNDSLVGAVAGNDVWVWSEDPDPDKNGKWYFLGTPSKDAIKPLASSLQPAMILMQDGAAIHAVALINGGLYETSLATGWESAGVAQWSKVTAPGAFTWSAIAPVFDQGAPYLPAPFANGWIAVANDGTAFLLQGVNGSTLLKPLPELSTASSPLAVRPAGQPMLLISPTPAGTAVDAWTVAYDTATIPPPPTVVTAAVLGNSFDWTVSSQDGPGAVFATKDSAGNPALAVWYPQATRVADPNTAYLSPSAAVLAGAPAVIPGSVVAPGTDAGILSIPFNPDGLASTSIFSINLATALVTDNAPDFPKKDDIIVVGSGGKRKAHLLDQDANNVGGNRYWLKLRGSEGNARITAAEVYRPTSKAVFQGTVDPAAPDQIPIDAADTSHTSAGPLMVTLNGRLSVHTITMRDANFITVKPKIRLSKSTQVDYQYLTEVNITPSRSLPLITQNLAVDFDSAVKSTGANFQGGQPAPNPLLFLDPNASPATYVLHEPWTSSPTQAMTAGGMAFSLIKNGIFGSFVVLGGSVAANPALSWEYFDGSAWSKIPRVNDATSNLLTTGTVSFCVPTGLQQTDVAGKKDYWIRARLVGGDYGQETVTVTTVPGPGGSSTQTFTRSQNGIDPPLIGAVNLTYSMCCATNPDFVLTSDSGTLIDQTSVNNSASAQIQLFLPLSTSIQAAASDILAADASSGPAIFLGFDGPVQGGPINILFLVKNQDLGGAYPLRVDVLRETGFVPITPEDGTRGLGESGILSVYLPDLPPITTLFGSSLRWLRLRPSKLLPDATSWTPVIYNAYVNAVYASASETQTMEHLGSSDGSPSQQVTVARPPVLEGSLEIRVLEPLDDDEVAALRAIDSNNVLTTLDDPSQPSSVTTPPPGTPAPSWVLWTEVEVIEEATKTQRAYTLDNDSGQITFGDGNHGMIPPIGQNSIVAVVYKRGGGSAANSVTSWTSINLISPLQGISQVVAPDDAAGGSDPETPDEILRLAPALESMRDRALTLRDFEVLAVQSSRDIAQARALSSGAGIRLVVAARGSSPTPTQAQWRAVLTYLTARCSPSLAAPNVITQVPPRLVQVQVTLSLDIEDVSLSGGVDLAATSAILALFDPATGGFDAQGWPLGVLPTETDIAGALADVPNLLAIEALTLGLTVAGVTVQTARPEDLPVVDAGNIQIEFQVTTVEVSA